MHDQTKYTDDPEKNSRIIERNRALARQAVRYALAPGQGLALSKTRRITEGQEITIADLATAGHERPEQEMARMVARGQVLEADDDVIATNTPVRGATHRVADTVVGSVMTARGPRMPRAQLRAEDFDGGKRDLDDFVRRGLVVPLDPPPPRAA